MYLIPIFMWQQHYFVRTSLFIQESILKMQPILQQSVQREAHLSAVNEQAAHLRSQTTAAGEAQEKNLFEPSARVKAAEAKEKQELAASLDAQKTHAESGVKNTGAYKKIEREIQESEGQRGKKSWRSWRQRVS